MINRNIEKINRFLFTLTALVLLVVVLFDNRIVSGRSMSPTLTEGERILLSPWSYGLPRPLHSGFIFTWRGVRKGEILVYNNPLENRVSVKRCVAAPGDRVDYKEGIFYVNGDPLPRGPEPPASAFRDGILPPDLFFCMGDNPVDSVDSRIYGPVSLDYLIGKVLLPSSQTWK